MKEGNCVNETLKTLIERRSVRAYDGRPVEDETLDLILQAGAYAPSGMNRQPTVIVAVRDSETVALLSRLNAAVMGSENDPFYGAATVVVVLADPEVFTYMEDGSLVMGNLLNAAYALGVDSCWIHRAREVFDTPEGKALLKKWGVDERYVGIGNCILGYGVGERPAPKPRREGRVIKV